MAKKENSQTGIGLSGLVFLLFLTLKLTETGVVANWSWWWVASPLWIPVVLVLGMLLVLFIAKWRLSSK